jgi:uncharacterized peroxidase-related enzyme
MSRIHTIPSIGDAPTATHATLHAVNRALGSVPNLFRVVANSPAALKGYTGLSAASSEGTLSRQTLERIAIAVAEVNACDYCVSAHAYIARNMANLDDAEISANRAGRSNDIKADAAVRFAVNVVTARGHVTDAQLADVKAAGYRDAEIVDMIAAVALNTLTNYINEVARTDIDFPLVRTLREAA